MQHLDQLVDLPAWDQGLAIDRQIDKVRREVQSAIGALDRGHESDDVDVTFSRYTDTVDKLRDFLVVQEEKFHLLRESYDEAILIADRLFELRPWRVTIAESHPQFTALRGRPPMWLEENLIAPVEIFPLGSHLVIVFDNETDMVMFNLKYAGS